MTDLQDLDKWIAGCENEHVEFKEAKQNFDYEKLAKYCVALANEGGGTLVLGVTDQAPRRIAGSQAFPNLEKTRSQLLNCLHFRVDAEVVRHPAGRVVVFQIPSRPVGTPLQYHGAYLMRSGESLVAMTPDQLKRILAEAQPDFSSEICQGASLGDLDPAAIATFRDLWRRKSGNTVLPNVPDVQLLKDAELLFDDGVTYAAMILFGGHTALGRLLPHAEVIFEYRSSDASIPFQQRREFREGFFLYFDELWRLINLRNDLQHFQSGLFVWDIATFNEQVVREAVLNAISHRDYRLGGSVFVRQFPARLQIVSPGGLPEGITPENIVYRQNPRNRRVADALMRCGLVERSGQGFDKITVECIMESKPQPDFTGTDAYQVCLTLQGTVQNLDFLRFLEQIDSETRHAFGVEDFQVLDLISRDQRIPEHLKRRTASLESCGVIEKVGRGRGRKHILSRRYYMFLGRPGAYTRVRGLDRDQNKMLLLQHLQHHSKGMIKEFEEVLPSQSRGQIHRLLSELRNEGKVCYVGARKGGYWELATQ